MISEQLPQNIAYLNPQLRNRPPNNIYYTLYPCSTKTAEPPSSSLHVCIPDVTYRTFSQTNQIGSTAYLYPHVSDYRLLHVQIEFYPSELSERLSGEV
jgi:hypothetical protein